MHASRFTRFNGLLTVALGLVLLAAAPAAADPVKCQREIAKRSAKYVQLLAKQLQKCEERVLKGQSAGPCPDGAIAVKLAKAESKLRASVAKRCGGDDRTCGTVDDPALGTIGWDIGACPDFEGQGGCTASLAHCGHVADCVACVDGDAVDQLIGLYFDALATSSDSTVLKCQQTIGKEGAKFLHMKSRSLQKCEDEILKGKIPGPCPDSRAASKIARAEQKLVERICKRCGGNDKDCGTGGDDLSPATIGFPPSCPNVTVPGGASCGSPITDLPSLVECVRCVTEFKADCLDALAVPGLKGFPSECVGATPTPTATATPLPESTATPTMTPTPTATATPNSCGDGVMQLGEDCDDGDDDACPGQCRSDCTCPPPCILPDPLPEVFAIEAKPGGISDSGWTGIAHDTPNADDAILTAVRLGSCDVDPGSPTCGQCDLMGSVAFPGAAKNCVCYDLENKDASSYTTCDPEAVPSPCGAPETCECFNGPPLPLVPGGIPVCIVNRYVSPVTGTANIADSGPHAGELELRFRLDSIAHTGLDIEQPCPICAGDTAPLDGQKDGMCSGGARDGAACDEGGSNPFFGPLSIDCPPRAATDVGNLKIILNPETTGTSTLATGPLCTAAGFTSATCFCDTCATIDAEPCNGDGDCPGGATCGGRRCLGGANAGQACVESSDCPGSFCSRPGQPTAPNQCSNAVCSPVAGDPSEGHCASGPFDGRCSIETFRSCANNQDCTPPPTGSCEECVSGQVCHFQTRACFLDPIVRQGTPGVDNALLTAAYCIAPTAQSAINQVSGLPGPGGVSVPVRIFKTGAQCGNGALDAGEDCDPPVDGACPGLCQPGCSCPTCGDGLVNQAGEECDGGDDAACPGACLPNCTCNTGVCGNDVIDFGEDCDGTADAACPGACQGDCTCGAVCGDGAVDPGEECDGPGSTACPAFACQGDCTCGPYCGDGAVDAGEECDGTGEGFCPGTCQGDCTCAPVCGDDTRQAGELCDGTDDALCPGVCTMSCTCPGRGEVDLFIEDDSDLDAGWTGTVHDARLQRGSRIFGEISGCDGQSDFDCEFFGNIGSFCSTDPSRACTNNNQCSGAGSCVIQYLGPPLPVSAGGVPACVLARFSTDAVGTFDLQSGDMAFSLGLNALAHLGLEVSQPCPICDCGAADPQDCEIGDPGTCAGAGIIAGGPCTVQGTGPLGPTSLECPPSSSLNVTGTGLELFFESITTDTISIPSNQPCDGSGYQGEGCICDGQTQPNSCLQACDGGSNDAAACDGPADCPGGTCRPLCRQIAGEALGEGECIAGPIEQTCANAPEIGCTATSGCPSGTGPCVARNQRCFMDPLEREGVPSTTANRLAAAVCVPATGSAAIDQTAGLPGPAALTFPSTVTAALCGDGVKNRTQEECDGGDDANCPGTCLPNCTCQRTCGNDIVEFGEQCDGLVDTACPGQCAAPGTTGECTCPPVCGDGFVGPDEQCDPGGTGGTPPPSDAACPGLCLPGSCQCPLPPLPQCGNGTLDAGEVCDLPATGCGPLQACLLCNQCFPPPDLVPPIVGNLCGNLVQEPIETCELPAMGCPDGDLCDPTTCQSCIDLPLGPICGNLNIETGELCELPGAGCGEGEICLLCQQCIPAVPICGNLKIEGTEACELPAIGCGIAQVCLGCLQCIP